MVAALLLQLQGWLQQWCPRLLYVVVGLYVLRVVVAGTAVLRPVAGVLEAL